MPPFFKCNPRSVTFIFYSSFANKISIFPNQILRSVERGRWELGYCNVPQTTEEIQDTTKASIRPTQIYWAFYDPTNHLLYKHVIVMFRFYNEYSWISTVSNYNFYRSPCNFRFILQAQDFNWSTWDICWNETSARMLILEWTTLFRILGRYVIYNIPNTRNTEKRVETSTRSGVFLTKFEVFE